ncbi:MAG: Rab family GTPase [Gammaproteobacteria bacterium]
MGKQINVKCVFIGDISTGKTSLLKTFKGDKFKLDEKSTIGASFSIKTYIDDNDSVKFEIWDLSGNPRYETLKRMYYQNTHAFYITIDATKPDSLKSIYRWKNDFADFFNAQTEVILVINKWEDGTSKIDKATIEAEATANDISICNIYYTSAKENKGISEMFVAIAQKFLKTKDNLTSRLDDISEDDEQGSDHSDQSFEEEVVDEGFQYINPYANKIEDYRALNTPLCDFDIVVKLLESYCTWIDWKHFKPEVEAILTLANQNYFNGNTLALIDTLRLLQNSSKYNKEGTLAQIIQAIELTGLREPKNIQPPKKQNGFFSFGFLGSIKSSLASDLQTLKDNYTIFYALEQNKGVPVFQILYHMLEQYTKVFNLHSHKAAVNAILTLYKPDPNDSTKSILGHTLDDFYKAIESLKNIEGYDATRGDLAAMVAVIEKSQKTLETDFGL